MTSTISLVLKTSDIDMSNSDTVSNGVGGWSGRRNSIYWNINLKKLMGDLWDQEGRYIFRINQISHISQNYTTGGTTNNVDEQQYWELYTNGAIIFKNATYNVVSGNNNNRWRAVY
mgnify:CR=1 FL=1